MVKENVTPSVNSDNANVEKHQDTQISCWTCHRGNIEPEKKRPKK